MRHAIRWGWGVGLGVLLALAACSKERSRPFKITAPVASAGPDFASALYQTAAVRLEPGHHITYVNDGRIFDAMEEEIGRARASVNILSFIWRPGEASERVLAALTARARAGVACRVLVDPFGSAGFEKEVKPRLVAAGCKAHLFRPLPADENLARNHRKLVLVDGRVGLTGGFAIQDEWLGQVRHEKEWRDTNVRVEGPAVAQMQQAFAENWQEATGELLPASDFPQARAAEGSAKAAFVASTANPEVTRAERITQLMVQAAKERLWISQAYFTPNDQLRALLVEKARAGVDVRVLAPGDKNDQKAITLVQRATYDELLPAGIRIWEFQPAMMHAKTMLVDDRLVLVGSINFDPLSFKLLEEGSLVVEDAASARSLEQTFLQDLQRAVEVKRD
jgi:cardiolipin synthase A/B